MLEQGFILHEGFPIFNNIYLFGPQDYPRSNLQKFWSHVHSYGVIKKTAEELISDFYGSEFFCNILLLRFLFSRVDVYPNLCDLFRNILIGMYK